jgi:Fe-S oxidoreductase
MAKLALKGEQPEILLWVGCAGSYDERYKKVTRALVMLLNIAKVRFAVLGPEEACTGDPARRAGNEFLFQMQAKANIQILNGYQVRKILTACPHCYNTIKNEYPDLGGNYEVIHHTQYIEELIEKGKIVVEENPGFKGVKITYHDSCYLGRSNNIYSAPRRLLEVLKADLLEMDRNRSNGFCCGAGGAQMFKESEAGNLDINIARTEEALRTGASIIAAACPFCLTMLSDGVKNKEKEEVVKVLDIVEMIAESQKKMS